MPYCIQEVGAANCVTLSRQCTLISSTLHEWSTLFLHSGLVFILCAKCHKLCLIYLVSPAVISCSLSSMCAVCVPTDWLGNEDNKFSAIWQFVWLCCIIFSLNECKQCFMLSAHNACDMNHFSNAPSSTPPPPPSQTHTVAYPGISQWGGRGGGSSLEPTKRLVILGA